MKVPFLDLGAAYSELKDDIERAVLTSLRSGWYIGGQEVEAFEEEFSVYTEARHCVSVSSGLSALHLALRAMNIGVGDEVIVPSNTFIATWLAVSQCGATPVPVEPFSSSYNIDSGSIEAVITSRTKAIIPVHLYGHPVDLDPILSIAEKYGLRVLEDAAQAHGAYYKNRRIGSHGDVVAWSFYPGKNLGAFGDAGAITTNDSDIADKVRELSTYGSKEKYINNVQGYNDRLDPVQAAALRVKLKVLDLWNRRRARIASIYTSALSNTDLVLPISHADTKPVWHLYVVQTEQRDSFQKRLSELGIMTLIHYPIPPHLQQAYTTMGYTKGDFPVAEKLANQMMSLPIGPHLNDTSVEAVITAINTIYK